MLAQGLAASAGELIRARPHAPVGRADRQGCRGDRAASRGPPKQSLANVAARSVSGVSSAHAVEPEKSAISRVGYNSGVPDPPGMVLGVLVVYRRYC